MEQRDITDNQNIVWTCVQAYAGVPGDEFDKAAALSTNIDGKVPVVCTPSGGARSVRLSLNKNWLINMPDEDLADKNQGSLPTRPGTIILKIYGNPLS